MSSPRILDVGCGNHSPTITKKWFPGCYYTGVDVQRYNFDEADDAAIDQFFLLGPDDSASAGCGYDAIPDSSCDFVILNHVLEHIPDPRPTLTALCRKLRPGGYIWIAFPSLRSLSLPPSDDETLQFCDDPTHVYVPGLREVANVLLANRVIIIHAGRSREGFLTTLGDIFKFIKRQFRKMFTGRFSGRGLWYLLGFEDHVLGQRRLE
jgi:SAM-dependent methyltransferase